jgi:signal transduction histidine kinase
MNSSDQHLGASLSARASTNNERHWHSTTFRWLSIYAAIFALSLIVLVGLMGWSVTTKMELDNDLLMQWQLIYFKSIDSQHLPQAIRQRMEHEHMHTNYYGLFAPDGRYLIGDILKLPDGLPPDTSKRTLEGGLVVAGQTRAPAVRALADRWPDGTRLVIARDLSHVLLIRKTILSTLIGGGLLCLIASFATGALLSIRQMRRVQAIRRATLRIADGDINQRLPTGGQDELDMLAHLVNHMLDRIEQLMEQVKGACDGIAHDLRTPLAHVRTLLANVADDARPVSEAEARRMIDQARAETDALLNRFRALLRISEIGAVRRRGGFESMDLSALVRDVSELYEPVAEDRGVSWVVEVEDAPAILGDRALLFEAFGNLLDNAVKFAANNGRVQIRLALRARGPELTVTDDGPGIPEQERAFVLKPAYRSERTRHLPGSGLGLSIVAAVADLHDFAIRIDNNPSGPGTAVRIECWSHAMD